MAMTARCDHLHRAALLSIAMIFGATAASRGDEVSAWSKDLHSAMRLIAGSALRKGGPALLRAGIEVRLDPGWKTYWRYPGDAGLPPTFDFAGSQNAKSITVLWPAPQRLAEGGINSIGYTGGVIFPLHIAAQNPAKPVILRAKVSYGVCGKICIPAEGKAELRLTPAAASQDSLLAAAEARVPNPAALGAAGPLAIRAAHYDTAGKRPRVIVDVTVPAGAKADLFAEGPDLHWSLPVPAPMDKTNSGPQRRFVFDVDGVPQGADIRAAQLKLTLVAGDNAIEVTTGLD
jgi:DsbC/DsbD-like thiol-disulfide interchange protein